MTLSHVVWRESLYIATVARTYWRLRGVRPESKVTIVDIVQHWAARTPDAPAILCGDQTLSYAALERAADRMAHWARNNGIGRGDCVALLMENRPEYVVAWLGLLKVAPSPPSSIAICAARRLRIASPPVMPVISLSNASLPKRTGRRVPVSRFLHRFRCWA